MKFTTRSIVQAALIAALYATLTLVQQPLAYGPIQFRFAEALTVLPAIFPASIPGLFIGCLIANWVGSGMFVDVVFGSLATLLAGISTYALRKHRFLYPLPPVIFNALIVGTYVRLLYDDTYSLLLTILFIGISEFILCYGLGLPLVTLIKGNPALRKYLKLDE